MATKIPTPAEAVAVLLKRLMRQGASELRESGLRDLEAAARLKRLAAK